MLESLPKHGANILDIPDRKLHIFSEVVMISKFYEPNEVYELTESDEDIDVKWICSTQVFDYRYVRLKRKYYIFIALIHPIQWTMDNSLSGRRRPARQTSEKDVLCLHRPGRSNAVHSPGGVWYFLPV